MAGITPTLDQHLTAIGAASSFAVENFPRFARRQTIARMLAKYEVFKLSQPIRGSIVECGVHNGAGVFSWAQFCAALEPYNLHRRVIGFDTFSGFVDVADEDRGGLENVEVKKGGFAGATLQSLQGSVELFDDNRFLNQFPKIELIEGDATKTIPDYVEANPHLMISLLYMDFDLYEPTKVALETLLPRMPKGAVLCFDEVNNAYWPGETAALQDTLGISSLRFQGLPFDPNVTFAVIE